MAEQLDYWRGMPLFTPSSEGIARNQNCDVKLEAVLEDSRIVPQESHGGTSVVRLEAMAESNGVRFIAYFPLTYCDGGNVLATSRENMVAAELLDGELSGMFGTQAIFGGRLAVFPELLDGAKFLPRIHLGYVAATHEYLLARRAPLMSARIPDKV